MIEIIIPNLVVEAFPYIFMWIFFGAMIGMTHYATGGFYMKYAIPFGLFWSFLILTGVYILVSLFTPNPIGIQIINISVGAP
jgi:hypothetical protein